LLTAAVAAVAVETMVVDQQQVAQEHQAAVLDQMQTIHLLQQQEPLTQAAAVVAVVTMELSNLALLVDQALLFCVTQTVRQ
jgi:hypothetical protein